VLTLQLDVDVRWNRRREPFMKVARCAVDGGEGVAPGLDRRIRT
jgi:hypothetical protein